MILTSRPDEQDPEVMIKEDLSVDPPVIIVSVNGQTLSIRLRDKGLSVFDLASILSAANVSFDYQEVR